MSVSKLLMGYVDDETWKSSWCKWAQRVELRVEVRWGSVWLHIRKNFLTAVEKQNELFQRSKSLTLKLLFHQRQDD